jgi:acetyl-CoA carboxylase, biotin carboxylase subunit
VKEQLHVAAGGRLRHKQAALKPRGWAMECRIYAEDPYHGFMPSQGRIVRLRLPSGPGVRNDVGIFQGYDVPMHYDPMLAKLIVYGRDREEARQRMLRALGEYQIDGIRTTIPFHRRLLSSEGFRKAEFDTGTIDRDFRDLSPVLDDEHETVAIIGAVIHAHERTAVPATAVPTAGKVNAWKLAGRAGRRRR